MPTTISELFTKQLLVQEINLFLKPGDKDYNKEQAERAKQRLLEVANSQNYGVNTRFLFDIFALFTQQAAAHGDPSTIQEPITALFQKYVKDQAPQKISVKPENMPVLGLTPPYNLEIFANAILEILQFITTQLLPKLEAAQGAPEAAKMIPSEVKEDLQHKAAAFAKQATEATKHAYHKVDELAHNPRVQAAIKSAGGAIGSSFMHLKSAITNKLQAAKQAKATSEQKSNDPKKPGDV
jgi:hypothetical protein